MLDAYLFTSTLLTLFVILDPPGLLPVFLGLTRTMTRKERNRSALDAALVAAGVIAVFAVFGRHILSYLHITVEALQVSGGLLLLIVALQLLTGKTDADVHHEGSSVAVVPLGIPLLAGPGSIVAMMLAVDRAPGPMGLLTVGLALGAAMALVWVFLRFAGRISSVLGDSGTTLATRVAGMLLAAIAVQMGAEGIIAFVRAAGL